MNGYLQDVCRYLHVSEEKCYGCFYGEVGRYLHPSWESVSVVMGVCFNRNESRVQSYREHSSLVNGSGGSISPIIENDGGISRSLILSYMESSGLDN